MKLSIVYAGIILSYNGIRRCASGILILPDDHSDQLQVEPNRAVHIGDDEKADKYGAAVVGIECW